MCRYAEYSAPIGSEDDGNNLMVSWSIDEPDPSPSPTRIDAGYFYLCTMFSYCVYVPRLCTMFMYYHYVPCLYIMLV